MRLLRFSVLQQKLCFFQVHLCANKRKQEPTYETMAVPVQVLIVGQQINVGVVRVDMRFHIDIKKLLIIHQ